MKLHGRTRLVLVFALGAGAVGLFLQACAPEQPPIQEATFFHFGTQIDVKIAGESEATTTEIFTRTDALLGQWHRRWHAWEPSELTALNEQLEKGETATVSPDLAGLIRRSTTFYVESERLFNPVIGKRLKAWGFQRHDPTAPLPAPEAMERPVPAMTDLQWLDNNQLKSANPEASLDLGGIAKGYALNALITDFRRHRIERAMINLGGDIGVLGALSDRPWRIGVLGGDGQEPIAALVLYDGEMAFSSGTYARKHDAGDGKSAHHIIDPRTGNPAEGNLATTVIGTDGERLQAASKVLLIAGEDWRRMSRRMNIDQALVVRSDGVIEITSALAARLEPMSAESDNWLIIP